MLVLLQDSPQELQLPLPVCLWTLLRPFVDYTCKTILHKKRVAVIVNGTADTTHNSHSATVDNACSLWSVHQTYQGR